VSDLALELRQTRYVLAGFLRNARAVVFVIVMPIVLLVLFNSIFGSATSTTRVRGAHIALHAYFTAGIIAYAIMLSAFSSLMISITTAREAGRLKRYRGTPMPPWVFLGAQILANIALVMVMVVALLILGRVAYDVHVPAGQIGSLAVYVVVGTAALCSLGIALTRFTTTPDAASAIGPFATVILGFISGTFIPVSQLPGWLSDLGRVFPLAHLAEGLQASLLPHGGGLDATNLAVLVTWGLAGLALALRTFAWEPLAAGD
jgi:ABC-2 type transport system permease protein